MGSDQSKRALAKLASFTSSNPNNKQYIEKINNFTSPLADTRMILRFFGLLSTIDGLKHPYETEKLYRQIEIAQGLSMMVYYPCEHVYWLGIHKILDLKDVDSWSRWSCQAWAIYIILDIFVIISKLSNTIKKMGSIKIKIKSAKKDEDFIKLKKYQEEIKVCENQKNDFYLRLIGYVGDLPLAIHWSLKNPILSPIGVGILGTISSIAGISMKWKYT
ncbi:hypothetical protein ROZALSC1DRAFT_29719 [Rozella allomycis CSF55]|uniref:Peroxisomal biogenesis factor 11 domain-containing protein n=1 Tax=Rozella allomycis (strain CSF55) TaxID=988480 RepID=A0A075B4I5_ROZAC|nr:Peroxisomal biogenesis factor 11 domain-containing protein [Rozella allomycis CSF55]RKP18608.1 hypothetical protein ROZALSC1DRAFT_29719 [Rozella allomycis CSF55]|eukprot:EPZ36382.1 Peroxisomal biogenesis factor 11 domain-containing protein [Rozella allomycis CSF55]